MKVFNKKDGRVLFFIFTTLILLIAGNLYISIRKGRDNIRKSDMTGIQGELIKYQEKYDVFPESIDGKIVACFGEDTFFDEKLERYVNLKECEWGKDSFGDLAKLPADPKAHKDRNYYYLSNTRHFQLYTSLEGKKESEYTESIVALNIFCGSKVCNFGKGDSNTPLNMSLEKYEEIKR